MKNLIKQILREETLGLSDAQINAGYKLMNSIIKGYNWYHDTPEQPFKYTRGSIWLINPETKKWILELKESGDLWYYFKTSETFSKFMDMEEYEFEKILKLWAKDVFKREIKSVHRPYPPRSPHIKDVLEKGIQMK